MNDIKKNFEILSSLDFYNCISLQVYKYGLIKKWEIWNFILTTLIKKWKVNKIKKNN